MNFGDILDQWDKQTGGFKAEDKKGADLQKFPAETGAERRRRLLSKRADAVIDLHNLTRDEAWASLETFFHDGKRRGFEKLLIIHGKGNHSRGEAVLSRIAREFIEYCPLAGESGHGNAALGGTGVTWVILK
ncbi:MAG: Smr/MutS family protein [Treponema sp.]|jgi:DNA-nicking Smr family endonuclease|nr:Smr/MutS family protein [Treponema sp.]